MPTRVFARADVAQAARPLHPIEYAGEQARRRLNSLSLHLARLRSFGSPSGRYQLGIIRRSPQMSKFFVAKPGKLWSEADDFADDCDCRRFDAEFELSFFG